MIAAPAISAEQRLVLGGMDWDSYLKIGAGIGERRVRVTYDHGRLEVMTVSARHEAWKSFIGRMLAALCDELAVEFAGFGSMSMQREDLDRGFEPDECYYIRSEPLVHGRLDLDLESDPPPDLAIEVEVSRSVLDRIAIYAALGIGELWRFDGETLTVLKLNDEGTYEPVSESPSFPMLPLDEFVAHLRQREVRGDSQTVRVFRQWVRTHLATGAGDSPASPL